MDTLLSFRTLPVMLVGVLAACDCSGTAPPPPAVACSSDGDCSAGQGCVDGACVTEPEPDASRCQDQDGDGRGEDCVAGPDCDDRDPARGGDEVCDGVDNDCNGRTDEGFEACMDCSPSCQVSSEPGVAGWTPAPENSEGVIVDDGGALTLGRETSESFSVWVANMNEGTVSKLDSRTNTEVARYPTTRPDGINLARPWDEACNWRNRGNCPSRTAVDQRFDAYVANRAFGNMGTVTKYANEEADCIDRNMNGVIDTSRDLNADGSIDLDVAAGEFVGPDDECILWTVPVGEPDGDGNPSANGVPRALAVGAAPPDRSVGQVWVGLFNSRMGCALDPATGNQGDCVGLDGTQPYGAVSDARGRIWFADRSNRKRDILGYVDANTLTYHAGTPVPDGMACGTSNIRSYGITADADNQLYVASSNCEPGLLRYDPATSTWTALEIPNGGTARGVAADTTHLWVSISHNNVGFGGGTANRIEQFLLADLRHITTHTMPMGREPVGVGVSFDGSIWAVNKQTNTAARLDPTTGVWIEHPVGLDPYTYSDFIGFGLNVFANPRGSYAFVVEGCASTEWQGVSYRAETPPGTRVEIWARTAAVAAALSEQPWVGPFSGNPANFQMPPGPLGTDRFLEVDIRLFTEDRTVAPRVFDIAVAQSCGPSLL
ncbi:MAG: hypothetical protein AAGF12_31510 [Myxococcota bacterium]